MKKIIVFLVVWYLMLHIFAFAVWTCQGFSVQYTQCLQYEGVWAVTAIFGWIPANLIAGDVDLSEL